MGRRALGVAVAALAGLLLVANGSAGSSEPAPPGKAPDFIPPAVPDPNGYWPTEVLIWGVAISPALDLVLASDINGGLYILRPVGL